MCYCIKTYCTKVVCFSHFFFNFNVKNEWICIVAYLVFLNTQAVYPQVHKHTHNWKQTCRNDTHHNMFK